MGAELLIQLGIAKSAKERLEKTEKAHTRGSTEVAATHLRDALKSIDSLRKTLVSPRLTAEENEEWKYLRDKGW